MVGVAEPVSQLSAFAALALSAAALLLLCGEAFYRRRYRQSVWIDSPERLLADPPLSNIAATVGGVMGIAAAVAWLPIMQQSAWSPIGLALSGLAILGWGHFLGVAGIGFGGLLGIGAALAAVPVAWFGATLIGPMIGLILAAGWMLWLAKFWDQQLDDGRAWTTTGALIPLARGAALIFAGLLLGQSISCFWYSDATIGSASRLIVVILEVGLAAVFLRNARRHSSMATTIGLWLVLWSALVAVVPINREITFVAAMYGMMCVSALRFPGFRTPHNTFAIHLMMSRFLIPCLIAILYFLYSTNYPFLAILAVLTGASHNFKIEGSVDKPLNESPNGPNHAT